MSTRDEPSSRLACLRLAMVLLLTGCAEGPIARPDPSVRKWVGPVMSVPGGGQFRAVMYFGPWQCSAQLMNYCRNKCAGSGHALQGCMWLADLKMDFAGTVMQAGSRFGYANNPPWTTAGADYPYGE